MTALEGFTILTLLAAIIPLALFIYYYGTRPVKGRRFRRQLTKVWTSSGIGIVVMSQKVVLVALLSLILIVRVIGDFPGRDWVSFGLYVILVGLFWGHFIVLRRTQKAAENEPVDG